jgi:hypothetical protein
LYSNFEKFNPEKGTINNEADRIKIRELVKDLEKYKKEFVYGYVGERDANGIEVYNARLRTLINPTSEVKRMVMERTPVLKVTF